MQQNLAFMISLENSKIRHFRVNILLIYIIIDIYFDFSQISGTASSQERRRHREGRRAMSRPQSGDNLY